MAFTGRCYITVSIFADNHNSENMKPRFFNQVTVPTFGKLKVTTIRLQLMIWDVYEAKYFIKVESALELLVVSNGLMTNNVSDLSIIILRMVLNLQTVYDLNRKAILKKYMTAEGKEVIYENFVTSDVILDWQGQSYFFPSKLAFVLFFIKQLEITEHHSLLTH